MSFSISLWLHSIFPAQSLSSSTSSASYSVKLWLLSDIVKRKRGMILYFVRRKREILYFKNIPPFENFTVRLSIPFLSFDSCEKNCPFLSQQSISFCQATFFIPLLWPFVNNQEKMTDVFCLWPPYLAICIADHKWSVSPIDQTNKAPLMQQRHLYPSWLWPHFLYFHNFWQVCLSSLSLIRILLNCVNMSKVAIKYECFWCGGISHFKVSKLMKRPQQVLRMVRNYLCDSKAQPSQLHLNFKRIGVFQSSGMPKFWL